MSRIIGDRKEKSTLDEMEEVARARNKDVAEDERLEALRKAKEEAERAKAPSEPIIIEPSMGDIIKLNGTPLCRNDYEALSDICKKIGKNPDTDYLSQIVTIENKRIVSLGLYKKELVRLPDAIEKLDALGQIDLGANKLGELPYFIGRMKLLKEICIDNNNLEILPASIETMTGLKMFFANRNNFDSTTKQMLERMKKKGVDVRY
ncbi:MAG: hypothetical protein WC852_02550 [Candidatus Nanoarchaeia archaeon]|jgi:Leucine-rich repeat (LRR) protein